MLNLICLVRIWADLSLPLRNPCGVWKPTA